jgi:hypothetical protein
VLSGSQAEVSVSMLQVKNRRSSPAVVVFASADCDDDGMKVAMFHCNRSRTRFCCRRGRVQNRPSVCIRLLAWHDAARRPRTGNQTGSWQLVTGSHSFPGPNSAHGTGRQICVSSVALAHDQLRRVRLQNGVGGV